MCSSRVSLGSLMSLSQPGSPEEIIFDHGLDLSDTIWRDVLHAVCIPCAGPVDQMAFSSCEVCSNIPGLLKMPISSLSSVRTAGQHLVLCPTSLLDGPIFRLKSFRLRPLMPTLSAQCVAADAEFAGLPFLGQLMKSLDVGKRRIDPGFRESFASVVKSRRPLIVFLEGRRSRGRRHLLRPRAGCVRALMDVALETFASVALLPVALSYQLVPVLHSK